MLHTHQFKVDEHIALELIPDHNLIQVICHTHPTLTFNMEMVEITIKWRSQFMHTDHIEIFIWMLLNHIIQSMNSSHIAKPIISFLIMTAVDGMRQNYTSQQKILTVSCTILDFLYRNHPPGLRFISILIINIPHKSSVRGIWRGNCFSKAHIANSDSKILIHLKAFQPTFSIKFACIYF